MGSAFKGNCSGRKGKADKSQVDFKSRSCGENAKFRKLTLLYSQEEIIVQD